MAVKTYTFTLDLAHSIPTPAIVVRIGDYDTNTFNVTITNEGEPFDLTGWTPQFEARLSNGSYIKDDGKQFKNMVVVDPKKGMISYTLVSAAASVVGTVDTAYFSFTKPDASLANPIDIVSTRNFKYKIIADAATGASGVAEHYISQIEILEWQVKQSVSSMQSKIDKTLTDATNKVNSSLTSLDKKINDFITKSDGQMSDFQKKLNDLDAQLKNMNVVKKSGDTVLGALTFTTDMPNIFKKANRKSWAIHHPDTDELIFAPSKNINNVDWDWNNGIKFEPDGNIHLHGSRVVTEAFLASWKQKHQVTADSGVNINVSKTDLNNLKNNGFYMGESLQNVPITTSNNWWFIEVQKHADTWVLQRATIFNVAFPETYERTCYDGTWKPWKKTVTGQGWGNWEARASDLLVNNKRAFVGYDIGDGDKLVINHANDFKNGVDVIGILKNNGNEVLTKSSKDTGWLDLTLLNGANDNGGKPHKYKVHNDVVYISASVGGLKDGMVFANIPAGIRPPFNVSFTEAFISDDLNLYDGKISVMTNGDVRIDWTRKPIKSVDFYLTYHL
ncbi:hypothetical protein CON64_18535 [Bacillus pseudomycoides]|nr:hypothetical protein CON64_18535 [Bacillus pseudomycoides]